MHDVKFSEFLWTDNIKFIHTEMHRTVAHRNASNRTENTGHAHPSGGKTIKLAGEHQIQTLENEIK